MKVVNIDINRKNRIDIGRRGEGNVRKIVFDCTYFAEIYGSGIAQLLHRRRGDEAPYPVLIEQDGNTVTWTVQEADTANVGIGEAELIWMLPDGNAKSAVYETETLRSLAEPGDPPEPWRAWVEEVLKAAESSAKPDQIAELVNQYLQENPIEIEETDPTVPEWAKQSEKPIYTAEEVGADAFGTAESKVSEHNVALDAHNDIRLLVQGLTERLNALADSDDTTLDQMSEVVAYIKSNKSLIDAITTSKVNVSDIIDNLTTNVSNKPLSAAQGVALKALIDAITTVELDETLTDNTKAAPADVVGKLKGDLDNYKDSISKYHKTVNLFDKSKITDGKILNGQNNEQIISSCFYTDYIPVEVGKTYCFQDNTGYLGQNGKVICCYDANKTFITSFNQNEVIVRDGAVIFTVNGSNYVRVNGRTSNIDSFMFVEGETLPEYEPYYAPYYEIKENVLPKFVKTVNGVTPDENGNVNTNQDGNVLYNPLYGKKLCVDGDSIMYGAGSSGGFAKIIGDNNSMTVVNNAVSGGTIASGTYHSDGTTARHWICDTIRNIPSDADYILFDGGVNDSSETAEIGAISSGFSAELDTTTFCGAMESICKWLVINRPNAKTGYVIVHKMAGNYTSEYPVDGQRDLYRLAIKICEKWGIPYIDLNTQVPPLKDIQSLRDVYTSNADGWHPNELGYKTFYVPKIEAFLRTL